MAAEDLLVDDGGHREAVKAVGERFPQLDVVSALACKRTTRTSYCMWPKTCKEGAADMMKKWVRRSWVRIPEQAKFSLAKSPLNKTRFSALYTLRLTCARCFI